MAELPLQDPNISICLDDGGEEKSNELELEDTEGVSDPSPDDMKSIVHSPTTDTLDSVVLEPSPSDDETHLTEETETVKVSQINLDEKDELQFEGEQNELQFEGDQNKSGVSAYDNDIIEKDSQVVADTQQTEQLGSDIQIDSQTVSAKTEEDNNTSKQNVDTVAQAPILSNYFGDSSAGGFFDDLVGETAIPTETQDPFVVSPRVRHISQPEPEPVSFECEEPLSENTTSLNIENEEALLEKETDSFEAFTAEGNDVPSVENLSVSPIHQSYVTPRHVPTDAISDNQTAVHVQSTEHGDLEHSTPQNEGVKTNSTEQDIMVAGKLRLNCTRISTQLSEHLSPVASPAHTAEVDITAHSGSPAPISPCNQPHALPSATPPFRPFSDSFLGSGIEDPFTASLQMNDADRRRDAWLPSDQTRRVIVSMVTSAPGTYYPSPEELCMPGLVLDDPQGDPVLEMLQRFSGEEAVSERKTLTADSVSQDKDGIRSLIESDCLRAAVDLVGRLITAAGQGVGRISQVTQHAPQTLQLWFLRLTLLTKLRLYSLAESESQAFKNLDTADLYYDYYPQLHPGKRGSMVPFGLRLLYANLPHFLGRTQDALDRLYYILAVVKQIVSNLESEFAEDGSLLELSAESVKASLSLWQQRELQVLYCTGNCLLYVKDFEAGLQVYEILLVKDKTNHAELLCAIGRVYLQMGDLDKASNYFKQFDDVCDMSNNAIAARTFVNHGLVSLSKNNFNEAFQHFTAARKEDPNNPIAVNNLAVCYLYMGKLKDSLATLENMIKDDPAKNLHEGVLFNLCTLYELESSRAMQKKHSLLEMVSQYKGDSFPVASLKLA